MLKEPIEYFELEYNKAESILQQLSSESIEDWMRHPVTQAVIHKLRGDRWAIAKEMMEGAYSVEESIDATVQRQAKAIGMAQAAQNIIDEFVEDLYNDALEREAEKAKEAESSEE